VEELIKLIQATAYLAGEKTAAPEDLHILADALWRDPKDRSKSLASLVASQTRPVPRHRKSWTLHES